MARTNARKRARTTAIEPVSNTPDSGIILGDKESTIEPTAPLEYAVESAYPEGPLLESQPS
jgi:hypothetical protein